MGFQSILGSGCTRNHPVFPFCPSRGVWLRNSDGFGRSGSIPDASTVSVRVQGFQKHSRLRMPQNTLPPPFALLGVFGSETGAVSDAFRASAEDSTARPFRENVPKEILRLPGITRLGRALTLCSFLCAQQTDGLFHAGI